MTPLVRAKGAEVGVRTVRVNGLQSTASLWYLGLAEADSGRKQAARDLWSRLLAELPANAPERKEVEQRIAALKLDAAK